MRLVVGWVLVVGGIYTELYFLFGFKISLKIALVISLVVLGVYLITHPKE